MSPIVVVSILAGLLAARQAAVLMFPKIVKVGFLLGGAYGEGGLRQGDRTLGYYNSAAASYGLQAGVQCSATRSSL